MREREKEKGRRHSKEREEESPARVEAADGQTLRDPQAGVFELRPLCRLPFWWEGEEVAEWEVVWIGVKKRRERERGVSNRGWRSEERSARERARRRGRR